MSVNIIVSVIITHFNKKDDLINCLLSIGNQTFKEYEVIIIDNTTNSDAFDYIKPPQIPRLKLIRNTKNEFFARAQNQGIEQAQGKYILCLNNDCFLKSDFLEKILKAIEVDSSIGSVCGKILSTKKGLIDSAGQMLGRSRRPVERGYKTKDCGQFEKEGYIFGVPGACALYKKEMLEDIRIDAEYFDEDYLMFYEDLDLNWRAQKLGWKAYYMPKAICWHKRGSSTKTQTPRFFLLKGFDFTQLSLELQAHLLKNRYMTIIKNDNFFKFIVNLIFIACYEVRICCYTLLFRPGLLIKMYKNMPFLGKAYQKRKLIHAKIYNKLIDKK